MTNFEVLGKEKVEELSGIFDTLDKDGSGVLEAQEIEDLFAAAGDPLSPQQVQSLIDEIDKNKDGKLDKDEFIELYAKQKTSGNMESNAYRKLSSAVEVIQHASKTGAFHSFSEPEVRAFSQYINENLAKDPLCKKYLPLIEHQLFEKIRDGVLLIKVINLSAENTIDERVINKNPKNEFQMRENHDLALTSASSLGCTVVNMGANDMLAGTPHLVLGLLWQIIRIGLVSSVNLQMHPGLAKLLQDGETLKSLAKLSPEELLIRWVNYHLANAGRDKRIKNFTEDIKDSEAYTYLIHEIAPKNMKSQMGNPSMVMANTNLLDRAEGALDAADKLDCRKFVTPQDVVDGNYKLNLAFVANLFNNYPGLYEDEEEPAPQEVIVETREEKTFRNWINSLGLGTPAGVKPGWQAPYLNHLHSGLADGLVILAIIDRIQPGIVQWNKVCFPPFHPIRAEIQSRQNCKYAIEYAAKLSGVKLVAIGGDDIYDQRETLTLGLVWQLMRAYTKNILDNLNTEGDAKHGDVDSFIITWVNETLEQKEKESRIKDFRDKSINKSLPIIELIDAIRVEIVDYSLVHKAPANEKELLDNAVLAINWGRKIGARIYALPEDIVEGKHKMVMTIFACLMERGLQNR